MTVLIDNGHGCNTPGKQSPDGQLREWEYTRRVARAVAQGLQGAGVDARLLVPEDYDVPLAQRVARANAIRPDLLVSIHLNASGMGSDWRAPSGWGAYVAPLAQKASCEAASALCAQAQSRGLKLRVPCPAEPFWRQSLAIVRDTLCPAVLTENLFMDNAADCAFLLSEAGFQALADIHVQGILSYLAA